MLLPRLRFKDVVLRGALYGAAANAVAVLGMLFVADRDERQTFLAAVSGSGLLGGGALLLTGLYFWSACDSDVRRWRDLRTISGQSEGFAVVAPTCVRIGMLGLLLFPGSFGLYHLVDGAAPGSWLYGS